MRPLRWLVASVALVLLASSIAGWGSEGAPPTLLDDLASPYQWCDAGDAYDARGEGQKAAYAYREAVVLGLNEAGVLRRAANFQLTRPDRALALPIFARLLHLVPNEDASIFGTYDGMRFGVDAVLARGLPDDRRAPQAYFEYLLRQHPGDPGLAQVWRWLGARGLRDERLAGMYVADLLAKRRYADAVSVWTDFAGPYAPENRVFNGSFETPPRPSPLDWSITSDLARRAVAPSYAGRFALKIDFTGQENTDFQQVSQDLVVPPGAYRLEAFVKTSGITTDEGIRLHLFDGLATGWPELWTDSFTGTQPWTRIVRRISVDRQTRLLTLRICRRPSQKIDNKVAGTAWIDAVSLVPWH